MKHFSQCGTKTFILSNWSTKILIIAKKLREVKDVIIIAGRGSSVATNMGVAQKKVEEPLQRQEEDDVSLEQRANIIEVNQIWYWFESGFDNIGKK